MSGMALWRIVIRKEYFGEVFVNTYVAEAASLAAAVAIGNAIVPHEKAIHTQNVTFQSMPVAPLLLGGGGGTVAPLSGAGTRAQSTDAMPLFNTVRVILRPASGKPSQKYLRLPLMEGDQTNGTLAPTFVTLVQTAYAEDLLAISGLVDPDGQPFVTATVHPFVQIRQLQRRRRSREGFRRDWVPTGT